MTLSLCQIKILSATSNPQTLAWLAMHQCYYSGSVGSITPKMTETEAGLLVVKHLLKGGRGHYSPLENAQITFALKGYPHSTVQQLTRHRVGVAFSVQSFRYTSQQILDCAKDPELVDSVFYVRDVGEYLSRSGSKYHYSELDRKADLDYCLQAALKYRDSIDRGQAEEHARSLLPFDIRQNLVMSLNIRSLMHILDLRAKKDAQLEIQHLSNGLLSHFKDWCPEIADWYVGDRLYKARLAP